MKKTALAISATLVVGCAKVAPEKITKIPATTTQDKQIISDRPQNWQQFIAILKLNNPALLTTATKNEDGVTVYDEELKKKIEEEQKAVIEKLKKLSPELKVLNQYKLVLNGITGPSLFGIE